MGKCSYTWEDWDREKGKYIRNFCQKKTWEGSNEFCIFHDPSLGRDVGLFKEMLDAQVEAEIRRYDFVGYYFPEEWDFNEKDFQFDADFRNATFQGDVDFAQANFQGDVDFTDATFQGDVDFRKANFQGDADFRRATFQDAYFMDSGYQGTADFKYAVFQSAHFMDTRFHGDSEFKGARFQYAGFTGVSFHKVHFEEARFQYAVFGDSTLEHACFTHAIFQTADFSGARSDYLGFMGATFRGDANFKGTIVQVVDFTEASFSGKVELILENVQGVNFRYAEFLFRCHVTADLSGALFHRSFIENVAFVNCDWPDNHVIYEEEHMKEEGLKLSFRELETIYRDLKQNMENHGDYVTAGEFYYREMEMRRKGASEKRRLWLEMYRFLAGYGEKPYLVIRNSFLVILLAAVLFFFCGVARVGTELPLGEKPDIINYSIHSLTLNVETLKDFGYCMYYSIVTFTTLGYGDIHPLGYSHVLASAEALSGAFFMALFVVVFARKIMR